MKKTYVKPMVAFENFQMKANIAGSCTHMGNQANGNSCVFQDNGWTIFLIDNSACTEGEFKLPVDSEVCYDVPTADTSIFNS